MRLLGFFGLVCSILMISCQHVEKIEKPENLLSKSEMKDLIYDMVLLDAAAGVNEKKLEELDIRMIDFLSDKYDLDSSAIKQNIEYYNLKFDDILDIYQKVKDSITRLEKSYYEISKARDSLRKIEQKNNDSIGKLEIMKSTD